MNATTRRPGPRTLWTVILAGPVIGYSLFWFVYLAAEAGCAETFDPPGGALRLVLLGASGASALAVAACGRRAWRLWRPDGTAGTEPDGDPSGDPDDNGRFAGLTGLILGGLFLAFVMLVAGPVVGSTLC